MVRIVIPLLVTGPHRDVAAARNDRAGRASSPSCHLVFLDADDLWHPETLATLADALERRAVAAGAFVLAEYVDNRGRAQQESDFATYMRGREDLSGGRLVPGDGAANVLLEHVFLSNPEYPPSCVIVRRTAVDAAGGFDGRFVAEDWEFLPRLVAHGPLVRVDRVMVGYRRDSGNASNDRSRSNRGAGEVWAAVYRTGDHPKQFSSPGELAKGHPLFRSKRFLVALGRAVDGLASSLLRRPSRLWMPPAILERISLKDRS